jgi:hypothetical protein
VVAGSSGGWKYQLEGVVFQGGAAGPIKKPCWPIRGEAMDWAGNVAEGSERGQLAPSFLSNASFGSVGAGYSAADCAVGST